MTDLKDKLVEMIYEEDTEEDAFDKKRIPISSVDFHGYLVTSDGHIYSPLTHKDMAVHNGQVRPAIDKKPTPFNKARLIYKLFYNDFYEVFKDDFSGPEVRSDEMIVFKDDNQNNCSIDNLRVVPRYVKGKDAWRKGFTELEVEILRKKYFKGKGTSLEALAKEYGKSKATIEKYLGLRKAPKHDKAYIENLKSSYEPKEHKRTNRTRSIKPRTGHRVNCYTPGMGERFKSIRQELDLSQSQFIKALGDAAGNIDVTSLSRFENDGRSPSFDSLIRIEEKLNLEKGYLLFGKDNKVIKKYGLEKKDLFKMDGKRVRLFYTDMSTSPRLVKIHVSNNELIIEDPHDTKNKKKFKSYGEYGKNTIFLNNTKFIGGKFVLE